ncbi:MULTISPECIES: hypothetical protein [unclassified Bradyrhizobium]|uniref:hypothetical protein n=1 Tax=unclassified Bradyrhizobium TaxID=2631580 RepID=UPI0021182516|nr:MULTISPECIES: hypothetical protein [unclassified Bradyrhizobium]
MRRLPSTARRHGRSRSDDIGRGSLVRQLRSEAADLNEGHRLEDLEEYIHRENLRSFRRRLDLAKDDARRLWLLERLAEEEARGRDASR